MEYDNYIEFTAKATVSIAGPVAVTEIDADEVRELEAKRVNAG